MSTLKGLLLLAVCLVAIWTVAGAGYPHCC